MILAADQWQLDDGPVLSSWGPKYIVGPSPDIGELDLETQDTRVPRSTGRRFGRDYAQGRTITLDISIAGKDEAEGYALYGALAAAWQNEEVWRTPGAVSALRYHVAGRVRRVHGRARKLTPNLELAHQGRIDITATFVTADPYFYADDEAQVHVPLVDPSVPGGLMVPAIAPFNLVNRAVTARHTVTVGGTVAAPLRLRINGPIKDPLVDVVDSFTVKLLGEVASDDWVEIDTRARTVLSRFGVNWAGAFTAGSQWLPDIALSPGAHPVSLSGVDVTGTASLDVFWRDTHASF